MKNLKFLLTAVTLLVAGNSMAQDQIVDLLPDGVTVNINSERRMVKEKNLVIAGSKQNGYKAFFAASDAMHGEELWVTDGTKEGTRLVKDILPGTGSSAPSHIARLNDKVLFSAYAEDWGRQLWVSDGTEEGTILLAVIYNFGDANPQAIYQINESQAVFAAISDESAEYDPDNGAQYWLWVTDGTKEGTKFVKAVQIDNPGKENTNQHSPFVRVGRKLFFKADDIDGHYGTELWVTDGTEEGTYLVKDINEEPNADKGDGYTRDSAIDNMENFNDEKLFFKAWTMESGNELWCSDGTEEGTYEVYDANIGIDPNNGLGLGGNVFGQGWEVYKGRIWFRGYSPSAGFEFCGSNLEKGDYIVHDIWDLNPSVNNNSFPDPGCVFQNTYMFCAANGFDAAATPAQNGGKMWCFDGEKCWIQKGNLELFPGTVSNWVKEPIVAGGSLYWMNEANDVALGLGSGLYRLDDVDGTPVVVTPITSDGDNVHTLRNLAGTIVYVCGKNNRLYVDRYTKPGWDGVSDAGYLGPDFIGDGTGIQEVGNDPESGLVNVYNLNGIEVRHGMSKTEATKGLAKGIYIVGKQKNVVR